MEPPLKPEIFEVLLALGEGPLHGYGIVQAVEASTAGRMRLAPSLLYRRLRRLLEEGLIEQAGESPGERGGARKAYALTSAGRSLLRAEARRLVSVAGRRRIRELAGEGGS